MEPPTCDSKNEESNKTQSLLHDDSDEEIFACQLGFFGQVVLSQRHTDAVLSRFEFCCPSNFTARNGSLADCSSRENGEETCEVQVDEDGDLVVPRRKGARSQEVVIIEHQQSTLLSLVGEQVWRGALFLADFILHSASVGPKSNPNLLGSSKIYCQSLTNGDASFAARNADSSLVTCNGDASLVTCNGDASLVTCNGDDTISPLNGPSSKVGEATPTAESVKFDYEVSSEDVLRQLVDVTGKRVLEVASGVGLTSIVAALVAESVLVTDINRGNILRLIERNLQHNRTLIGGCDVRVGELDFCNLDTIENLISDGRLRDVDVILAADVVYHNDLTDAFFDAAHRLLSEPPCKTLLVALEKRYVFTTTEYDVVAPCYDYFLHCLDRLKAETSLHPRASQLRASRQSEPENISQRPSDVPGRTGTLTSAASTELCVSDSPTCNGLSIHSSFDSKKLSNGNFIECSATAPHRANVLGALGAGLTANSTASQSSVADNLGSGVIVPSGDKSCSKKQHPSSSCAKGHGRKDRLPAVYQHVKYAVKQLQYDDFPQYFAYDRTKELVLWKINAELS